MRSTYIFDILPPLGARLARPHLASPSPGPSATPIQTATDFITINPPQATKPIFSQQTSSQVHDIIIRQETIKLDEYVAKYC